VTVQRVEHAINRKRNSNVLLADLWRDAPVHQDIKDKVLKACCCTNQLSTEAQTCAVLLRAVSDKQSKHVFRATNADREIEVMAYASLVDSGRAKPGVDQVP
jgi:hypothetical protein